MWGIGWDTAPVPSPPALPAVLVNPGVPLATAGVFQALSAPPAPARVGGSAMPGPFRDGHELIAYLRAHGNDLESAAIALEPRVGAVLAALDDDGSAALVRMSGSGPTCFALYETAAHAEVAARRIQVREPGWWVVATTLA